MTEKPTPREMQFFEYLHNEAVALFQRCATSGKEDYEMSAVQLLMAQYTIMSEQAMVARQMLEFLGYGDVFQSQKFKDLQAAHETALSQIVKKHVPGELKR